MLFSTKSILIIDDDEDINRLLEKILQAAGYNTESALNLKDAKSKVETFGPHVILLDFQMSNQESTSFLHYLKKESTYANTPVFMLSANSEKSTIIKTLEIGATDFIPKPIVPGRILQKIRKVLKQYELPVLIFEDDNQEKVTVESTAELIKINEVSCIIETSTKFPIKSVIGVQSPYLNSLEAENCRFQSSKTSTMIKPGVYQTKFTIKGLTEKSTKKIRQIKVTKI